MPGSSIFQHIQQKDLTITAHLEHRQAFAVASARR